MSCMQECDRLGDFEGVRDFLEYKSPGSSREGDMARALINSEQELAREHSRYFLSELTLGYRKDSCCEAPATRDLSMQYACTSVMGGAQPVQTLDSRGICTAHVRAAKECSDHIKCVCRVIRRPSDGSVKHYVGQIMTHARYHYKGVIYGEFPALSHIFSISDLVTFMLLAHLPHTCVTRCKLCCKLAGVIILL